MRPKLELPRLSLAERDRRWAAVRKEMVARNLDAIVLWGWPTMWDFYTANARYLAPIGWIRLSGITLAAALTRATCRAMMFPRRR